MAHHAKAVRRRSPLLAAALGIAAAASIVAACGFDDVGVGGDVVVPGPEGGPTNDARPGVDAPPGTDASDSSIVIDAQCSNDVATDPLHCGRCGHSCLGGACVAGMCVPITLATRGSPHDLVVDATNVYWTDKGDATFEPAAARCPKAGGAVVRVATGVAGTNDIESLVVAANRVYLTDTLTNFVQGCALPGPDCAAPLLSTENGPLGIAWNGTALFWVNGGSGNIRRSPPSLVGATSIVTGRPSPQRIAVTATKVAWTESTGIGIADIDGQNENEATSATAPRDVAIDASFVYFATASEVRRVTHGGGGNTLLANGVDIQRLVVDANGIYFTDRANGGRVLRCPLTGCVSPIPREVVAVGDDMVFAVAVDATHVYWTNQAATGGTIRRVAR